MKVLLTVFFNYNGIVHHFVNPTVVMMMQPPYSPDMIPFNFFLFTKVKKTHTQKTIIDKINAKSQATLINAYSVCWLKFAPYGKFLIINFTKKGYSS